HDLVRPLVDEPDLLGLNGLGHFVPLVLSFPTIPNLAMVQKIFANVFTVLEPLLSTSKDGVRTTGAICLILALSDQSSLCKIAATTMSSQKRPLTALSTPETAAAVKMIIVPSNNQTLRVGSTNRVITPTSGQAPGQAMIVSKPMTIQHTPSETGQTAVHANKTATKSPVKNAIKPPSGSGTITILSRRPSSGKTTGAVRMICNVEKTRILPHHLPLLSARTPIEFYFRCFTRNPWQQQQENREKEPPLKTTLEEVRKGSKRLLKSLD
ncbi:hypothetical protein TYRP_023755, partial [Tyrophagus putrescentiae]